VNLDMRKVGFWALGIGGFATTVGLVVDATRTADDPTVATKQGVFDFSGTGGVLFFGGIAVAIIGIFLLLFGDAIYRRGAKTTTARRLAQVGAPLAAVVLLAGCAAIANNSSFGDPSPDPHAAVDAAATTGTTVAGAATGTTVHSHDETSSATGSTGSTGSTGAAAGHDHGQVIPGTATGTSPCEVASPTPASPGQVGAGSGGSNKAVTQAQAEASEHGERGMVVQVPITQTERVTLEAQMAQARTVVAKYPTVKDAEAAGYRMSTVYVPCIGAHYTNYGLITKFDPAAPSELLYDGTKPDSKIVGLSYLVFHRGGQPDGFAGSNDHWHQHNANGGLCFGGGGTVIGGEELTREQCTARGGQKRELTDIWMMHAWVVPGFECSWGVFSGECPELGGKIAGTAWN
jgi:hypothetical protein